MAEREFSAGVGMYEHQGSCHCGNVWWRLRSELSLSELPARSCQCSFCRKHGALSTSDPRGEMRFAVQDPFAIIRYEFATRTADFLMCGRCGVYVGALMKEDDCYYGIANLNMVHGGAEVQYKPEPMDHSGEDERTRRGRRTNRWTPVVRPL